MRTLSGLVSYWNKEDDRIEIFWDSEMDGCMILNYKTHTFKYIDDLKNCPDEIWEFIASDFKTFNYVNDEMIILYEEQVPILEKEYEDGSKMLNELLNLYEIELQ